MKGKTAYPERWGKKTVRLEKCGAGHLLPPELLLRLGDGLAGRQA